MDKRTKLLIIIIIMLTSLLVGSLMIALSFVFKFNLIMPLICIVIGTSTAYIHLIINKEQ